MSNVSAKRSHKLSALGVVAGLSLVAACGSSSKSTTESTVATTTTAATTTTVAPTTTPAATTTVKATTTLAATTTTAAAAATTTTDSGSTGAATLTGPATVGAGEKFDVQWTGPNAEGDYITIVAVGTAKWTNEPWFYTLSAPSPRPLVAPIKDGAYELWYVDASGAILARRPIGVAPFSGALGGPAEVEAGSNFQVAWNGPNGPGDYVTIVAVNATKWTNESYFYTSSSNPGTLVSPIDAGDYVLWYVTGTDDKTMATRPIKVTPFNVTLDAPASVKGGSKFEVKWTGPNGPQDYITIVPAGSAPGTYASYAYTTNGSPVTITADTTPGAYEIWYASDRVKGVVFGSIPITVT